MSRLSDVLSIGKVIAAWLDPDKREVRILRSAIGAAKELHKVLRRQGRYQFFSEQKLKEYETHFQKQFDAWEDGQT